MKYDNDLIGRAREPYRPTSSTAGIAEMSTVECGMHELEQLNEMWRNGPPAPNLATIITDAIRADDERLLRIIQHDALERMRVRDLPEWSDHDASVSIAHYERIIGGAVAPGSALASLLVQLELECAARDRQDELRAAVERLHERFPREIETALNALEREHTTGDVAAGIAELLTATRPPKVTRDLPSQIGPYHVLSKLGEGGFGVVWLAERRHPHKQRVALKVIKPGMDTAAVIARFEQERQALAVMDHPNIARVFDAGTTDGGRPYFVMEHVQGEPITHYCDRHNLSIRERLELFSRACDAVQHAHMKGIIHRDIKPSNVLVSRNGDQSVLKVIDFGVAKAISHTLTDKTIFTEHGQILGTPEYMSPEQAEMGAIDIDTRTDVYSLGVVLYELLAGALPFDPKELRAKGYNEVQRIIREVDPPKPSTRFSGLGDGTAAVAKHRRLKREELLRELSRELDWIPLKAMRKDRAERYSTPTDLADDIQRYLNGEPLEAGPESARYRIRKFVRRNRGPVIAVATVMVVLTLGIIGTSFGLVWAKREAAAAREAEAEQQRLAQLEMEARRLAEQHAAEVEWQSYLADLERQQAIAARKAEEEQKRLAQLELTRAELLNEFIDDLFVWSGSDEDSKLPEMLLRRAESMAEHRPTVDPIVRAMQYRILAHAAIAGRRYDDVRMHINHAREILNRYHVADPLLEASLLLVLALSYYMQSDYDLVVSACDEIIDLFEVSSISPHRTLIRALSLKSEALFEAGKRDHAAEAMFDAFLALYAITGRSHTRDSMISDIKDLAIRVHELRHLGRIDEAVTTLREELQPFIDVVGPDRMIPEGVAAVAMYIEHYMDNHAHLAETLYLMSYLISKHLRGPADHVTDTMREIARFKVRPDRLSSDALESFESSRAAYIDTFGVPTDGLASDEEIDIAAALRDYEMRLFEPALAYARRAYDGISDERSPYMRNEVLLVIGLSAFQTFQWDELDFAANEAWELILRSPELSGDHLWLSATLTALQHRAGAQTGAVERFNQVVGLASRLTHRDVRLYLTGYLAKISYLYFRSDADWISIVLSEPQSLGAYMNSPDSVAKEMVTHLKSEFQNSPRLRTSWIDQDDLHKEIRIRLATSLHSIYTAWHIAEPVAGYSFYADLWSDMIYTLEVMP